MDKITINTPISDIQWIASSSQLKTLAEDALSHLPDLAQGRDPSLYGAQSKAIIKAYQLLTHLCSNIDTMAVEKESISRTLLERAIHRHDLPYVAEWLTLSMHAASGDVAYHITLSQWSSGKTFPEQNDKESIAMKERLQEALGIVQRLTLKPEGLKA